ncbi:methyl-accepting chemotaxis protein [Paenibacillus sp. GCM10027627]|uniref:methyl-accepting chemotaxis protein n=1 Tax=unclassified Paenibacillus TaxID=185978 RepID=UPI00363E041F
MKLSLRLKLSLLAVIPLIFYVGTGLYLIGEEKAVYEVMSKELYEKVNQVDTLVLNADRDLYQTYSAYLRLETGKAEGAVYETAEKEMAENRDQAIERIANAKSIMASSDLLHLAYGESGRQAGDILDSFEASFGSWYDAALAAVKDGVAKPINQELDAGFLTSRTGIDEVAVSIDEYANRKIKEIGDHLTKTQRNVMMGMIAVAIALAAFCYFMIKRLMTTIRLVVQKSKLVSEGDLTSPKDAKYSKDELGQISQSVDEMIDNVNGLIAGIKASAEKVSVASGELSLSANESAAASQHVALIIQEVAEGSEIGARGAEETSRAIEEMAVGVGKIAENTSVIADRSVSTVNQTADGRAALERLAEQMNEVNDVVGRLSSTISSLEERSKQIGAIAENITAFSNQTNILSLNASIEAARAGEHGKGFAVVAGEIRKLAASSLESAGSINDLVAFTQKEIAGASAYMQQTTQVVEQGSEKMKDVSHNLNLIAAAVHEMTEQLHENSAITEQMSASSEEVSATMEQSAHAAQANLTKTESVAAATEEQLALMENISAASGSLDEIVRQLSKEVAHFKVRT